MSYDNKYEGSGSTTRNEMRPDANTQITGRNEQGRFVSLNRERQEHQQPEADGTKNLEKATAGDFKNAGGDMTNMLRHIEMLERKLSERDTELVDAKGRVEKFSQRTREGMQSALDSLMKKWMDAVETKDDKCKEEFKKGMEKLVQNSAEDNGVWQMMVAASSLYEKQEHNLDQLKGENNDLKQRIDGSFSSFDSRTERSLGKRKADTEADRSSVGLPGGETNIWQDFANDMAEF